MSELKRAIAAMHHGQYYGMSADDPRIPELLEMLVKGEVVFHHLVTVQHPPGKVLK